METKEVMKWVWGIISFACATMFIAEFFKNPELTSTQVLIKHWYWLPAVIMCGLSAVKDEFKD